MRIWKRLNLVSLLIAVIVTLAGYAVWNSHFAKYRAHSYVQVAAQTPRLLFRTIDNDNANEYKRYQRTQQVLVKSALALNSALRRIGSQREYRMVREQFDPVAWLQAALEVEFVNDGEVMEIALRGDYPDEVAGLVNAVTKAYLEEVVDVDTKRRADRLEQLKKLKQTYQESLKEQREAFHKLSQSTGASGDEKFSVDTALSSRYQILLTQSVKLPLDRAETETLLGRRRTSAGAQTDHVRKEIAQLEDLLAVLTAQEKVLNDQLKQTAGEIWKPAGQELDLETHKAEIALMEDVFSGKILAEIEALNVELGAAPRVRLIEDAVAPRTREGITILGW